MKNKIYIIGWMGIKRCYLNISLNEAIQRFCVSEGWTIEQFIESGNLQDIKEAWFDDEFGCYEAWSDDDKWVSRKEIYDICCVLNNTLLNIQQNLEPEIVEMVNDNFADLLLKV